MKYRKLRIAWSVAWGIVSLLLIVLWVRSYFWVNHIIKLSGITPQLGVASGGGLLTIRWDYRIVISSNDNSWIFQNYPKSDLDEVNEKLRAVGGNIDRPTLKMGLTGDGAFLFPYWLPALITGAIAAAPWLPWRFSLRTLLVAMTVAAIGLGWIVYWFK